MSKKSCGSRKRGIRLAIPKHRVGGQAVVSGEECENHGTDNPGFLGISRSSVLSLGEKFFEIMLASCEKLYLVGFTRTETGEYVLLNRKRQIRHLITLGLCLALCIWKTWATVQVFLFEGVQMESFMCLGMAVVYNATVLLSLGNVMRPKETMDLLNSWSHVSASLKKISPTFKFHLTRNISTFFKVLLGAVGGQVTALALTSISLVMSDLPIFFMSTAKTFGWLPEEVLPRWAWQAMFVLLELLVVELFILTAVLSTHCLYICIGALDVYLQQLRRIEICSMKSRRRVERMYVELELFNRIAQIWIRYYFPPLLLAFSSGTILGVFGTIRFTTLPLLIYILFPYIGSSIMVLIFWQSYDMINVTRRSEDILGKLWQHEAPYFRGLTRAKRVEVMKRSKAMRPLAFPVGDSEFSLNLPISTYDEIINQTLFLLSL